MTAFAAFAAFQSASQCNCPNAGAHWYHRLALDLGVLGTQVQSR